MLSFFPTLYPNELLYSAIARYHFYIGNIDYKDTLEELFNSRSVIPSVEFITRLNQFISVLGPEYSATKLIESHTLFPYYSPFISKEQQQKVIQDMLGKGEGLYTRIGYVAGSINKKEGLYYCSRCAGADIQRYGEPYIHREHQLQGIRYCGVHEQQLLRYPVQMNEVSRICYVRFIEKNMNLSYVDSDDNEYKDIEITLSKMALELLNKAYGWNIADIRTKYLNALSQQHLLTASHQIRQNYLFDIVKSKFSNELLERLESEINISNEYNWLKVLSRKSRRLTHPIRHLLFQYALNINLFDSYSSESRLPFGLPPYPCLNVAAEHYQENVISKVVITRDSKTGLPIGTFSCKCGLIYARKGPDTTGNDRFKTGRIKNFGPVWIDKLRKLDSKKKYSIREIARIMSVDSKTVKKYLLKDVEEGKIIDKSNRNTSNNDKEMWISIVNENKDTSRTALRKKHPQLYLRLYRLDKNWLFNNSPDKKKKAISNSVVDWNIRDMEYLELIEKVRVELLQLEKPTRITKSLLGRKLNILNNLEKYPHLLPKTTQRLKIITESINAFQLRRGFKLIDAYIRDSEPLPMWKLQRVCGLKTKDFNKLKEQFVRYLNEVRM